MANAPWFPQKMADLDKAANRVLMYGSELDADHPVNVTQKWFFLSIFKFLSKLIAWHVVNLNLPDRSKYKTYSMKASKYCIYMYCHPVNSKFGL